MCRINDQKVAIVIFPSLPIGLESTDQSVGDRFRLSPPLAKAHSNPTLSPTTIRQRSDCYRDVDLPDRKRSCPDQSVRFNILMEREVPRRVQPSGWWCLCRFHNGR